MKQFVRAICAGLAVFALAQTVQAGDDPRVTRVFVSIPPQKFLADRIGGDRVDVRVMLEPGHAPETFDPSPRRMAEVAGAEFYFSVGVPFEKAWLPEIRKQNPELRVIDCCVQDLEPAAPGAGRDDPHVWVSPMRFLDAAHVFSTALAQRDTVRKGIYTRNYRDLSAELVMLHRDLRYLLGNRRIDEFIISHAALGPLALDHGLIQIALESGGREVGPETLAGIAALARRLDIRAVFAVKQNSQAPARALARELDAELIEIDPLAENYLDNMRAIGRLLAQATQ
ncbi:MAG: zinc ABC transporter substrate-binding protein [Gammaproteobacteria bacterium]|nr:zinc ABC transporter substrate-binding protein [Gammaproteobacteria bacterium]